MSAQYGQEFKKNAVEKLLGPSPQSALRVAETLGVPIATLYGWKKNYANLSGMKNNKKTNRWSREEKLNILIKTSAMTEAELGVFLRENGLYSSDLQLLREEILIGPKGPKKPSVDPELIKARADLHRKEKELRRKDRTIAEMAARVVLLKKSHEIWGEPEEDE